MVFGLIAGLIELYSDHWFVVNQSLVYPNDEPMLWTLLIAVALGADPKVNRAWNALELKMYPEALEAARTTDLVVLMTDTEAALQLADGEFSL